MNNYDIRERVVESKIRPSLTIKRTLKTSIGDDEMLNIESSLKVQCLGDLSVGRVAEILISFHDWLAYV